ncbi:uncharacterized protein FIBRA_02581 [Fibroporia radiculosa]|uniref:Beta-lactamase-related domain-containing protein n=1 Tax=Fibroporia radiculosa TaxID=599839 RepID=J4HV61_9APHY|nr:uncharacterized protein FIBRA_02581 [Fibroporia radiculosa]CCM00547.1 predicted protein [Fibroporia radiculosa]
MAAIDSPLSTSPAVKWAITPTVSTFAEKALGQWNIPGMSVGVVRVTDAGEVQTDFGGWGKVNEDGDPPTPDTLFYIASCSKAFLASAIGILMDDFAQGQNAIPLPTSMRAFTWDTKVCDLFPSDEWLLEDEWTYAKMNIRDLLAHVTGLAGHDLAYSDTDSALDIVKRMRHLKSTYELRERYCYNNQMYVMGAHIVTIYSGMSFTTFVKKRILVPLGMHSSTYFLSEAEKTGQLSQSWASTGRLIPPWLKDTVAETIAGPGGLISNVVDMTKWMAMLLNRGVDPSTKTRIMPEAVLDETTMAHYISEHVGPNAYTSVQGYGLGWSRQSYLGHEIVSHSGAIPGIKTITLILPLERIGVVALTNMDGEHRADRLTSYRIIEELLELKHASDALLDQYVPVAPSKAPAETKIEPNAPSDPPSTEEKAVRVVPLPLEHYTGTFTNPAYGSFTLCTPSTESSYAREVIANFASCSELDDHGVALYTAWRRMWASHVRLRHHEKNIFLLSYCVLFPHGYGKDTTPFAYKQLGGMEVPVEFDVQDGKVVGLGILDVVFDPRRPPHAEGSVEQRADVWFSKECSIG